MLKDIIEHRDLGDEHDDSKDTKDTKVVGTGVAIHDSADPQLQVGAKTEVIHLGADKVNLVSALVNNRAAFCVEEDGA